MLHSQCSVLSFHHLNSLPLGLAHHLELPSGFFRRIEDIFFLQVHQIHLEIYLRKTTLTEIKGLIWAASVDIAIPPSSYSFRNPELTDGFHLTIFQASFWKWLKGHMGSFFLSLFRCHLSSFITLLKWIQLICNISVCLLHQFNCPQEDALCVVSQFLFDEMQWHIWQIGKQ